MPIYHFNLAHHHYAPDDEGTELDGLAAARKEAAVFAGALLRDHPALVWEKRFEVQVTDDSGARVCTVAMDGQEH